MVQDKEKGGHYIEQVIILNVFFLMVASQASCVFACD